MDEDTAKTIVIAITVVGALVWLAALTVMVRATRERQAKADGAGERYELEGSPSGGNTIAGGALVDGQPEDLSAKLVERLASNGLGLFGPVKIVACDRNEVVFAAAGPDVAATPHGASGFRSGRIRLTGHGSRTQVDYAVETSSRGAVLLTIGWLALALGLVALVAAPWLQFTYVLPNPNLRAQAAQTFQMVHFLWPPFLFAFLSRQPGRMIRGQMDALVNNLPY